MTGNGDRTMSCTEPKAATVTCGAEDNAGETECILPKLHEGGHDDQAEPGSSDVATFTLYRDGRAYQVTLTELPGQGLTPAGN
jgi:hypothetical protein